jgi:uracil-DNA glycosylase family 4
MPPDPPLPGADCDLCPRVADMRSHNRAAHPEWFNAPVPSFGPIDAPLLIIGLAPGLKGANRTGRPFTGDFAGDLLYQTLLDMGLAEGSYGADPADGLRLCGCRITNAVRCVPPQNKPTGAEIRTCRGFLAAEIAAMPALRTLLALGRIAHETTLAALGLKRAAFPFAHGTLHRLDNNLSLLNSYHCSRYNTNTGRLSEAMFRNVFEMAKDCMH